MQIKAPQVFREYDIRGVADRDLTNALAEAIGRGYGTMIAQKAGRPANELRIAVGRDCRLSSPRLHEALLRGLALVGLKVIDIGVGPTPLLYFAVFHLNADGGVMITGSHNPGDENGFKMMRGKASFYGQDIQDLRRLIEAEAFAPKAEGSRTEEDVTGAYVDEMKKRIPAFTKPLKVVVDAGNGSGGPLAIRSMKALGLEPEALYCEMDGHFPNHHPDPTVPKNVAELIDHVTKGGARVGIAYDGDADRLGAVDANGDIVWGDRLMIVFSRALLKERPGAAIIGEVKCSQTLYDDIAKHGGEPIMWKTGHSLIKTKMKESGALLAGEMSGHLFFADRYFGYDDAIYASLRLLEILAKDPRSIDEMLADVPKTFSTPELREDCPDAVKVDVVKAITARYKAKGNAVNEIDGARISFGRPGEPAWGLVRASNTGPVLVLRFEATSEVERDRIRAEVEGAVREERAKLGSEMTNAEQPQVWTIEAVLRWATDDFRARGIENPRLDAQVLLAHALGVTKTQLVIDSKRPLESEELAKFRGFVKRRRMREPVAYVLGVREFYGRSFRVDRRVLVPRPDTETLVDVALARTRACSMSMRALDLCTGSGCVAITLSRERPTARVHATDLSEDALAVARENALRLGAYPVSFTCGDLLGALPAGCGPFDVIVANPPYITTAEVEGLDRDIKEFEPRLALDGGADGLAVVRRLVDQAPARLAPGGCLAIEIGAGEAAETVRIFEGRGFTSVNVTRDYGRIERVVDGVRP